MKTLEVGNETDHIYFAVDIAIHQHGLEACIVHGDPTVCSCRHSKMSAWLEACTVYGDPNVCSCRHSKTSAWLEACILYGDHNVCSCRHSKLST